MPDNQNQAWATPFRTMIGGQALIEGIMMLGPDKKSIVVRRPDGGLPPPVPGPEPERRRGLRRGIFAPPVPYR